MARHVPHVFVPIPWGPEHVDLTDAQLLHLTRVVRIRQGAVVSYTDGAGTHGSGQLSESGITRGEESKVARPSTVTMAVAPIKSTDRARFVVEKLQELGVAELRWLVADYGQCAPPKSAKSRAWAVGALEQSRGVWLMSISGPVGFEEFDHAQLLDGSGQAMLDAAATICIGPEGGWSDAELAQHGAPVSLGMTVLRTETAAVVAAAQAITCGLAGGD